MFHLNFTAIKILKILTNYLSYGIFYAYREAIKTRVNLGMICEQTRKVFALVWRNCT